jgi:cell division protein FtsB
MLYAVSAGLVGYFLHHAHEGDRGMDAKRTLKAQIIRLNDELAELKKTRASWERRMALMRDEAVDRDLLDERARDTLGWVHRNDVVVYDLAAVPPRAMQGGGKQIPQ